MRYQPGSDPPQCGINLLVVSTAASQYRLAVETSTSGSRLLPGQALEGAVGGSGVSVFQISVPDNLSNVSLTLTSQCTWECVTGSCCPTGRPWGGRWSRRRPCRTPLGGPAGRGTWSCERAAPSLWGGGRVEEGVRDYPGEAGVEEGRRRGVQRQTHFLNVGGCGPCRAISASRKIGGPVLDWPEAFGRPKGWIWA